MKKLFCMLLLTVLLLTACSNSGDQVPFSGGSGTEADPYLIRSSADLWEMANLINGEKTRNEYESAHYRLTADIDLGGSREWTPIEIFSGVLDGDGHTVSGLSIRYRDPLLGEGQNRFGLVGELWGTIRNLTVSDSRIEAEGKGSVEAGALAGNVFRGTIENCHTTQTVRVAASYMAGGICANISSGSVLRSCTNGASVHGTETISSSGGIAARAACPVENCENAGTITCEGEAAGIAVSSTGGIFDCVNSGSVTARDGAGGITVHFSDGALNHADNDASVALVRCVNSGEITSSKNLAGGIAVGCRTGSVIDCVNTGSISAPKEAGGILAYFQPSSFGAPCELFTVSGCVNSGSVTNTALDSLYPVGGICGRIYDCTTEFLFENCKNSGAVVSGTAAGGILGSGSIRLVSLTGCVNSGAVRGVEYVGGMVGRIRPCTDEDTGIFAFHAESCQNTGAVYAGLPESFCPEIYAGGILGHHSRDLHANRGFTDVIIVNCENTGSLDGDASRVPLCRDDLCGTCKTTQSE